MPDLRSLTPPIRFKSPEIESFSIIQDSKFLGFKNEIRWNYSSW